MPTIIRMSWGLANRMFQYSYYLYLRQRGVDAYIDYCGVLEGEHERVDWKHVFPQAPLRQATKGMLLRYGGGQSSDDTLCDAPQAFTTIRMR